MDQVKQGFIVPVFNHGKPAVSVTEKLAAHGLPIILVDDGSNEETKAYLAKIAAEHPLVVLVTLKKNIGKGGAVKAGIKKAHELGLTHILQVDADGQHDTGRAGFFLEESAAHPEAFISGRPEYDSSVPKSRKNGRKVANTWAKIVTLSSNITDVLCGFRVYPVEPTWRIIQRTFIDNRMGFDVEILVRLYWKRVPIRFCPVQVTYPEDGLSHFHPLWSNVRISIVFTRLCIGMFIRLPIFIIFVFRNKRDKK
ncbi:MAG: glycosyltransferase family 2 protein [Treponema sp.]|jgi:glycosyltransferase involved in cell wall biosynthesis|nr:glycosyltransferase family 2 protein [Treponema sp.]